MSQTHEYFEFGSVSSKDYDVWISGENTFAVPERDVTVVEVPGRNGTLTLDNGRWKNVKVTYPCYMSETFLSGFDAFKNALLGVRRVTTQDGIVLWDTYHPDVDRIARLSGVSRPTPGPYNKSAQFELTFDCWPQQFLRGIGFTPYSSGSEITPPEGINAAVCVAYPIIHLTFTSASATASLRINGIDITVESPTTRSVYINCFTQRAYYYYGGNPNMPVYVDDLITLDDGVFPCIDTNVATVSYTVTAGSLTVELNPRWWRL